MGCDDAPIFTAAFEEAMKDRLNNKCSDGDVEKQQCLEAWS